MAKESLSKMMSEINKLAHKFDSSNPNVNELLDDWLNSYSTIQLGAIGHILGCIFLFYVYLI